MRDEMKAEVAGPDWFDPMPDAPPVVLVGIDEHGLGVVGLFAMADEAAKAVQSGKLPTGYTYSVVTPKLGSWTERQRR
jgi:hypothetical protein